MNMIIENTNAIRWIGNRGSVRRSDLDEASASRPRVLTVMGRTENKAFYFQRDIEFLDELLCIMYLTLDGEYSSEKLAASKQKPGEKSAKTNRVENE